MTEININLQLKLHRLIGLIMELVVYNMCVTFMFCYVMLWCDDAV